MATPNLISPLLGSDQARLVTSIVSQLQWTEDIATEPVLRFYSAPTNERCKYTFNTSYKLCLFKTSGPRWSMVVLEMPSGSDNHANRPCFTIRTHLELRNVSLEAIANWLSGLTDAVACYLDQASRVLRPYARAGKCVNHLRVDNHDDDDDASLSKMICLASMLPVIHTKARGFADAPRFHIDCTDCKLI